MSGHAYTEDRLVEQPAIGLFSELAWQTVSAMEDALDEGLRRSYTKEIFRTKCNALFEHLYESYFGDGNSVYLDAA